VERRDVDLIELGERRSVDGVPGCGKSRRGLALGDIRFRIIRRFSPAEAADDVEPIHAVELGQRPDRVGRGVDAQGVKPARYGPDADRLGPDLVGIVGPDREIFEIDKIPVGPDL
jgi:hypothetical protein